MERYLLCPKGSEGYREQPLVYGEGGVEQFRVKALAMEWDEDLCHLLRHVPTRKTLVRAQQGGDLSISNPH